MSLPKHPQYEANLAVWEKMRDCYDGEDAIKVKGVDYLSPTAGMELDGALTSTTSQGYKTYVRYKERAVFHELVSGAVELMLGLLHFREPLINLPTELEPLRQNCTKYGESLKNYLRRINEAQLVTGRIGSLVDIRETSVGDMPYFVTYSAEACINWSEGDAEIELEDPDLSLVALDETHQKMIMETLSRETVEQYRVLEVLDGIYQTATGTNWPMTMWEAPSLQGRSLSYIPFVFVNSRDTLPDIDVPPLRSLANTAVSMYRSEADYRQSLHMQGQDTLVIKGGDDQKTYRIGSGASILTPVDGDAKFIGVTSTGLPEQRTALLNDMAKGKELSSRLVSSGFSHAESGEALRIRVGSQTATLGSIASASARALEFQLKAAAEFLGTTGEGISVVPNMNFIDGTLTGNELVKLLEAKNLGAPISLETLHVLMKRNNLTNFELDQELKKIASEASLIKEDEEPNDSNAS